MKRLVILVSLLLAAGGVFAHLAAVETQSPGYHQEALVPLGSETHAGEDVGVWARGPGAHLLTGTNEQSLVFHVMAHAGGLLPE